MKKSKPCHLTGGRNSSIELIKVFGIILVVISHVVQTLHSQNDSITVQDYVLDISLATTNVQQFVLTLLRYSGALGNTVFFVCSAWFLLDSEKVSKKKLLQMLMDIWSISIIILIVVYVIRSGDIGTKMIIKNLLPTTFSNNWYITCYLIFYSIHPFLNWVIKKMDQRTLLKATLVLLFLYVFANFVISGLFFMSEIILWVTIYFTIAYAKYYLTESSKNIKINILLLGIGFAGNVGMVLLTNILGLHFEIFSNMLLRWNSNCNPFLLLIAISMLNIARNVSFENKIVNYISSLSLLIYVFHENLLLRTFYRPLMWNYVYTHFGYEHILVWMFVLVLITFGFGLIVSIIYKHTLQKVVTITCNWLYSLLQKIYEKAEKIILQFH